MASLLDISLDFEGFDSVSKEFIGNFEVDSFKIKSEDEITVEENLLEILPNPQIYDEDPLAIEEEFKSDIKFSLNSDYFQSDSEYLYNFDNLEKEVDPLDVSNEEYLPLSECRYSPNQISKDSRCKFINCDTFRNNFQLSQLPIVHVEKLNFKVGETFYASDFNNASEISSGKFSNVNHNRPIRKSKRKTCNSVSCKNIYKKIYNFNGDLKNSLGESQKRDGNKILNCLVCNYRTKNQSTLNTHVLNHAESKFKCFECDYETKQEKEFAYHLLIHSDSKIFHCFDCDYKTNVKNNMKSHTSIHYDMKSFKCFECDFKCTEKCDLQDHLLKEHSNINLFKCFECDFKTNIKNIIKTHILIHYDLKLFKCFECNYECSKKYDMQVHILKQCKAFKTSKCIKDTNEPLSSHSNEDHELRSKLYKCSKCNYATKFKKALKKHLGIHSDVKLFKCSKCNYQSNYKHLFKSHMIIHENTKLLKCSKCDYKTKYPSNLKFHLLNHNIAKYKCFKCSYESNNKIYLKKHLKTHSNVK